VCVCVAHEVSNHIYDETCGPSALFITRVESKFPRFGMQ
jgi:hypothetical protein